MTTQTNIIIQKLDKDFLSKHGITYNCHPDDMYIQLVLSTTINNINRVIIECVDEDREVFKATALMVGKSDEEVVISNYTNFGLVDLNTFMRDWF